MHGMIEYKKEMSHPSFHVISSTLRGLVVYGILVDTVIEIQKEVAVEEVRVVGA